MLRTFTVLESVIHIRSDRYTCVKNEEKEQREKF